MVSSGVVVHLSDGLIEAHFHFFVMIPVVALYEAWLPFAFGVCYVLVHHGIMGTVDPRSVYNHPAAWDHPFLFAGVHAGFFAAASAACIVNWWLHERARSAAQGQTRLMIAIVDSMSDGLAVVDADERVVLRNPSSIRLLGATEEEWEDWGISGARGLFHTDGSRVSTVELPQVRALAGDPVSDLDLMVRRDDDETVLSFSATALDDGPDEGRQVVVVFRDITERHRTEQALATTLATEQQVVEQLRAVEQVKAEFVSTVSHELRTPITSIMGYLELLEDGETGPLTAGQHSVVDRLDRNSRRLLLLVDDLLTHSRIESSTLTVDLVQTDVRDVVWAARDAVAGLLTTRSLELSVDVPPASVQQRVDPAELERALVNLLSNAVKFTPDGGTVDVRLTGDADGATVVVSDTGLGIPEDEQARLFTRFFRTTTAAQYAVQGTGLGLAIVHSIVSLHGGSVEVDSAAGEGSTFTVRLPRDGQPPSPTDAAGARVPAHVMAS